MNKIDIKRVIGKLEPSKEMEYRLSKKIIQKQHKKFVFRPIVSIAASLVIIISIGIIRSNFLEKKTITTPPVINSSNGIDISKISPESAEYLLGEKLGTTKGNIDEWSKQDDYAVDFASTIEKRDVYAVKGYDKSFRIMTYQKVNETTYAEFISVLMD
jgi:hypothetical protein